MQRITLSANWQIKQRDPSRDLVEQFDAPDGWIAASVPGVVHLDLLRAGQIPDPFYGLNENAVQWIGETDWLYRCTFDVPYFETEHVDLCFEGLDTFATVWLNGERILVSDNMFLPARVPISKLLQHTDNRLHILLESALRRGQERQAQARPLAAWNGDASRLYVRKAQYHYGWDWGPCLITAGVWRAVHVEAYTARIAELHAPGTVSPDLREATLPVEVVCAGKAEGQNGKSVSLALYSPSGSLICEAVVSVKRQRARHTFRVDQPELWFPRGYGAQPLYRLVATLKNGETELDSREVRIGLRRLRLVQEPLANEPGKTFFFEVNNIPLFCGGANWIPADSFTPRVTPERYRAWLTLAADANMLMLRVWGGGIYEEDVFYDLCDELGLLVWQDFMFACGMYPANEWFQTSVRAEAEAQVRRLRHHPCLALWCGNNEDYQIAESLRAYNPDFNGDFVRTEFPARAIYERLLPDVCITLDATRPYWPGSPYGGKSVMDQTIGDRHTWEVWHGNMADYRDYARFYGRFVSEFGMQAFPDLSSITAFAPDEECYAESRTIEHHNKAGNGPQRLAWYLAGHLRAPVDFAEHIYATQFIQAEALGVALDSWRRRWGGPRRYSTAGALVWQLNDCWPVISWALADYSVRPKPAYYRVKRGLAPISLGMAAHGSKANVEVWGVNTALFALEATLELVTWTPDGTQVGSEARIVTLAANRAVECGTFTLEPGNVLSARLIQDGRVLARAVCWPEPPKYYPYADPGLSIRREDDDRLRLEVARPARGVYLMARDGVAWSDNMLDLIPGDPQVIAAVGLRDSPVQARWLGAKQAATFCL